MLKKLARGDKRPIIDGPDDGSALAQAALAALLPRQTLFELAGGWSREEFARFADYPLGALVELLRSGEHIPEQLRKALADALDPAASAPRRLLPKAGVRAKSPMTLLDHIGKMRPALAHYEACQAAGMSAVDALADTARAFNTNEYDLNQVLIDARADRKQREDVERLRKSGASIEEICSFLYGGGDRPKPGRPRRG